MRLRACAARIVALRNEKGSYNPGSILRNTESIVALRNEKGSYNLWHLQLYHIDIVALRNEKGSYNRKSRKSKTP